MFQGLLVMLLHVSRCVLLLLSMPSSEYNLVDLVWLLSIEMEAVSTCVVGESPYQHPNNKSYCFNLTQYILCDMGNLSLVLHV